MSKGVPENSLECITGKDGAKMVLIPAGEFQMGRDDGSYSEKPAHTVYLDAFYIDQYEVTNAMYAGFLSDYGRTTDEERHELLSIDNEFCLIEKAGNAYRPKTDYEDHPVVMVSWYGAVAYAQFYDKRLPTDAEWEKAARGGLVGMKYPWGNDEATAENANYDGNIGCTTSVGSYPPNNYGLYDMAGNVWECCADWYDSDYYASSPYSNPTGPNDGTYRALRGGSWTNNSSLLRVERRYYFLLPTTGGRFVGFRCVSQD